MNSMRMTFTLVVALFLVTISCKKEKTTYDKLSCPVTTVKGPKDKIIGKWKLVSGYFTSQIENNPSTMNDYSCNNIVYEFNPDGKLVVTSDLAEYVGQSPGTVDYTFSLDEDDLVSLSIGEENQNASISSTTLDINNTAHDGWVLKLLRVE